MMKANPRRERIRAVIRAFFKDKRVGDTITDEALAKYREDLRRAAESLDGDA
jgi:hypothetical protein